MEEELAEHSQEAQSPQYLLKLREEENTKRGKQNPLGMWTLDLWPGGYKNQGD